MADMFTSQFHVRRFLLNLLNVTSLKMIDPCFTYFKAPERRNADICRVRYRTFNLIFRRHSVMEIW